MNPRQQHRADHRTFESFSVRNFRLWFFSQTASMVGYFAQVIAQALLVLQLTSNGAALGLITALQFLPSLVLGPYAGLLADRYDKRRLMLTSQGIGAVIAVAQGVVVVTGIVTVTWVILLAAVSGIVFAFDQPCRRSIVTELVAEPMHPNAVNLNGALNNSAKVIGPAVAGAIVSVGGLGWCFLANGLSSIVGVVGLLMIDPSAMDRPKVIERSRGQVSAAVTYLRTHTDVGLPIAMAALLSLFSFNWNVLVPLLAERDLDGTISTFSILMGTMSVGSLAGSLWLASRGRVDPSLLRTFAAGVGISLILLGVAATLPLALLAVALIGFTSMVLLNSIVSIAQLGTEPQMRGRIMALFNMVLLGGLGIGGPMFGWLAQVSSARVGLMVGGTFAVGLSVAMWRVLAGAGVLVPLVLEGTTTSAIEMLNVPD